MLAGSADISIVSKRLGHSSIGVTSDLYPHLLQGVGRQAADAADAADALVPTRATKMATDVTTR